MIKTIAAIFCMITLCACSKFQVKRDLSEDYDFKKLKTYKVVTQNESNLTKDTINGKRAIENLERVLREKGYTPVTSDNADFMAVLDYENIEFVRPRSSTIGLGIGASSTRGSIGGLGLGYGIGSGDDHATLRVRFLDGQSSNEIWKGSASGDFEAKSPDETNKNFSKAMKEILKKFPDEA